MKPSANDLPPAKRGDAPADLHAYRGGERLSHDERTTRRALRDIAASVRNIDEQRLARALGWFSVALGVAEVVAPRQLGRAIGMNGNANLLRAMDLREIASGVGILTQPQSGWMWSRVAGDAMDLALLGAAMTSENGNRTRLAAATAAVAGVTALDIYCSQQMSRNGDGAFAANDDDASNVVRETITVNAAPDECYRMWRDFPSFPRFMRHVESVRDLGNQQYHWVVKAPAGGTVEWDSRITADDPNRRLAWETLPGSDVQNRGSVEFEPATGGRGAVVRVEMSYVPPAGALGAVAAKVTGQSPEHQVRDDLRRFKEVIETGEIPSTEGQPAGRRSMLAKWFTRTEQR